MIEGDKMKKAILIIPALFMLVFLPAMAQDDVSAGTGIIWNGSLLTNDCIRLKSDQKFSWQEYRWTTKAEVKPSSKAHFYGELWVRSWGVSNASTSADLLNKDKVAPYNIDVREAYVDIYGFLLDNLDIRAGKQRIAWGTADKLNPTDNLNPKDLEDIWDFGRHLGSSGFKASYYMGDYTLTAVYIPIFTPATLPRGDWASVLSPAMSLPSGMSLHETSDILVLPENTPQGGSTSGIKLSKSLLGYDLSISYLDGRDDLPVIKKVTITPVNAYGEVDVAVEEMYSRRRVLGADLAGTLAKVGVWGEMAVYFPDKVTMITDLSAFGMGTVEMIAIDDQPYVKGVIGADYTFKNGIYINSQYLHGFIHERGKENLEDYLMLAVDRKFLDEKLKVRPINGGIEVKDTKDIKNNFAIIFMPELSYQPVDNATITLGLRIFDGKTTTTFGKVKNNNEACVKLEYSF